MRRSKPTLNKGLYRSRYGIVFGVCRGIAEYFNISVFWTRALALFFLIVSGFWPTGVLYIVAALLMKKGPSSDARGSRGNRSYYGPTRAYRAHFDGVKSRFSNLERRMRNVEDIVTSKEYDCHMRLNT